MCMFDGERYSTYVTAASLINIYVYTEKGAQIIYDK
jgi:hypothetical protein